MAICYSELTSITHINLHDGARHFHFALHLFIRRSGWVCTFESLALMIRLSSSPSSWASWAGGLPAAGRRPAGVLPHWTQHGRVRTRDPANLAQDWRLTWCQLWCNSNHTFTWQPSLEDIKMCFWGLGREGVEICVLFNYISIVYFNPRHGKLPCVWLKYIEKIKDSRTTLFFYHVYFNPECKVFHHLGLKYTVEIWLNNTHISTPLPAPSFVSARCGAGT